MQGFWIRIFLKYELNFLLNTLSKSGKYKQFVYNIFYMINFSNDSKNNIIIKGAKENNLKNVTLSIPKYKLNVFTGLSGSGKSTLAFDTIYTEGQRRYIESLSSYARQFLGNVQKPEVESIEGLSPAIAIEQKTVSHNPRSIVGTITEIYDYLRLLFARIGVPYCPNDGTRIESFTFTRMVDIVMEMPIGTKIQVLSPIVRERKGTLKDQIDMIKADGFERVRFEGNFMNINEIKDVNRNEKHNLDVVIDRIILKEESRERLFESCELASKYSDGYVIIYSENSERLFSIHNSCPHCGFSVPEIEPRLFSFNAPLGWCKSCHGLGIKEEADPSLIIPDPNLTIREGGIKYYKNIVGSPNIDWQDFKYLLDYYGISIDKPLKDMTDEEMDIILNGSREELHYTIKSVSGNTMKRNGYAEGVKRKIERLYNETQSQMTKEWYYTFIREIECTECHGARLTKEVLSIKIDGKNIYDVTCLQLGELLAWIRNLKNVLTDYELQVADLILKEIDNRVNFLCEVGLDYLTLARTGQTLSGGEAQRIRLATQIGSKLSGVLYVLDEPSIGLHQRDTKKLIKSLKEMVDLGNTLIVVEHDEETIRSADNIVEIGPGAGVHGGEIVAEGSLNDIIENKNSITGDYLSGRKKILVPPTRKKVDNNRKITLTGCEENNLKNIKVSFPLGLFVCISGVSGSGKSTLVNETLYKAVKQYLGSTDEIPGKFKSIKGLENIDKVIDISQEPIGRTPRSNPATYIKVFDDIRDLFAETREAKAKGFTKGRFSFNNVGGRCEKCEGAGVVRIPMNFLPDVYIKCDECEGRRYNEETLLCTYKDKNIFDVLEMTVEDALKFFENRPNIYRRLKTLYDVGLGYIKLGQPATTLSGGEAQRVKLAYELQKRPTGKTLYILDEPTTGLHTDDIRKLLDVLQNLVNHGDTIVVIEHNLDVLKVADYIIDLGPEGGEKGGYVVATGTPEEIAENPNSYTGECLKEVLSK